MIKVLVFLLLFISSCGKKGELFLDNEEDVYPVRIDEERVYKF